MKIIRVEATQPLMDVAFHPDSTVVLRGRPLFMPEEGCGWLAEIWLAVKISRLGKNIGRKFAPRYYDGVSCAMRLVLPSVPEMAPVIVGMDSSIVIGEWTDPAIAAATLAVTAGGQSVSLDPQAQAIDEAISAVSRYTTLKMGDVILLPAGGLSVGLEVPGRVTVGLNGLTVIDQKLV